MKWLAVIPIAVVACSTWWTTSVKQTDRPDGQSCDALDTDCHDGLCCGQYEDCGNGINGCFAGDCCPNGENVYVNPNTGKRLGHPQYTRRVTDAAVLSPFDHDAVVYETVHGRALLGGGSDIQWNAGESTLVLGRNHMPPPNIDMLMPEGSWPGIYSQHEALWVLDGGEAPSTSNILLEYDGSNCVGLVVDGGWARLDPRVCQHMVNR